MKTPLLLCAAFAGLLATARAQVELPVGSVSANQSFALRSGSTFTATNLDAYQGKILVLMMMTPWCPHCQANTIAAGDGILDYFNATSRGTLKGKNDAGIEIRSVLLSTEPASSWDNTNASFSVAQGFQQWGLDASATRTNPRVLLGYYRGGFINDSNLYSWGEDRRRLVVLNLVNGSASHEYREILINQNHYDSSYNAAARAAINAVQPAPVTLNFNQWATARNLQPAVAGAAADADGDQVANLLEFFHGTNPTVAETAVAGTKLENRGGALHLAYKRAKNIGGFMVEHLVSTDLVNWTVLTGLAPVVSDGGTVEEVSVALPPNTGGVRFYRLRVRLN